jgi:hypothetical protein
MKKTLSIVSILLAGVAAYAADLSQLTLSISTPGPDLYADGTPVLVGETYLLVYVKQGATFQGVLTDGTLVDPVNNSVATRGRAIEGSKCGFKAIQYPADLYPSGGSWVIVLFDTRDASGTVGGLVAAQGVSAATAAASGSSTALNGLGATSAASGESLALTAATPSQAPADTPSPVISAVEPQGATVQVRIQNFTDKAIYEVQSTTDLASGAWQSASGGQQRVQANAETVVTGANGAAELPVPVAVPENDRVRFFRVIVPGSN